MPPFNPGKGHLFGRDLEYLKLSPGSLVVGEGLELKELPIGANDQVLTIKNGKLVWAFPEPQSTASGQNVGSGEKVLKSVVDGFFTYRTLVSGFGIDLTENDNDITIEVDQNTLSSFVGSPTLGTPTDGDLSDPISPGANGPAITNWTSNTLMVDAIDDLNEVVGLLLPEQPPGLEDIVISMSGGFISRGGSAVLLADGNVTDNTGGNIPSSGTQIYRIDSSNVQTSITPQFGPGNSGVLSSIINGNITSNTSLSIGDDTSINNNLEIVSDQDYPISTPGFWEAITARITANVNAGVNSFQLSHTESGDSNELVFLYDDIISTPNVSSLFVSDAGNNPAHNLSSGIPHYASNSEFNVDLTVNNLSSNAYLSNNIIQVDSPDNIGPIVGVDPGEFGISDPLPKSVGPISVIGLTYAVGSNNISTLTHLRARGRNAHTDGPWTDDTNTINIFSGNGSGINELSVPFTAGSTPSGADDDAKRIELPSGDNPTISSVSGLTSTTWDSTALVPNFEAKVVGGILKQDTTDYSVNYLPPGPDYSGHNSTQYCTWFVRKSAVSQFDINITGTYAGLWVTMSGINFGIAPNGWLDMFQLYAGAGIPGQNGDIGCAVGTAADGNSGTFTCTFGPETSSNADNNIILIRFRLNNGQAITNLEFT